MELDKFRLFNSMAQTTATVVELYLANRNRELPIKTEREITRAITENDLTDRIIRERYEP